MEDITLSREDIYKLTGYRKKSKQAAALRRAGIRFIPGADGYPRVCRYHLIDHQRAETLTTPNSDALKLVLGRRRR